MPREIKFRVWHAPSKMMLGVWKIGYDGSVSVFNREVLENGYCGCDPQDLYTKRACGNNNGGELSCKHPVMQYTGLKDKTGAPIYEGDVVRVVSFLGKEIGIYECVWATPGFHFQKEPNKWEGFDKQYCEVIGNVWQNPELIK